MKKLLLFCLTIMFGLATYAQIGINTTKPDATLHIEGNLIVTNTGGETLAGEPITATKVLGLDENGNIIALTLDTNIYIEDNIIKSYTSKERVGSIPVFPAGEQHNVSLIIFPGGTNGGKSVIRMSNGGTGAYISITGFDVGEFGGPAAADGFSVWLYASDNDLKLRNEDIGSSPENRIAAPGGEDVDVNENGMIRIMYDATIQRWVVMTQDSDDDDD
ncbi:hypothetical protein [Marinirhabdus gelatinilytica]|uniref:Uncharacterized protein n=1 Tax=Marinirhabdus gelatinilytica TaxID=1703343 RepID=A0A370Q4F2_9FLAO|nr:hypothetical protein [Marinirhabdus gelatinilytica]RDK83256.1 hypothetical protein C8D94_10844 [Marinirhabdus gelatinilytica]